MKRDLSTPLAPTFPDKPKRKVKKVTKTDSGGTKKVVFKTNKDGTRKLEKRVSRGGPLGKVVYKKKVKSPKGNKSGVEKTKKKYGDTVVKTKTKTTKDSKKKTVKVVIDKAAKNFVEGRKRSVKYTNI
jgi:hypothetical protein